MRERHSTTKMFFLVLAVAVYSADVLPQHRNVVASECPVRLRFGQSVALSDFDSDGLIDEARIDGSGSHKGVKIPLSRTGKLLVLDFDTVPGEQGSLIAQDVDDDGATDLVWTDLLHTDDVIVWLGDGKGQFERVSSKAFGDRFTLGDRNVDAPSGSSRETALNCGTNRPLGLSLVRKYAHYTATELPNVTVARVANLSPALGQPAGRSPPFLFS
jgi:hypothetical protein